MQNTNFTFVSPVKAHFAAGSRQLLPKLLDKYDRIGVVSGRTTLDKTGMRSLLRDQFPEKELTFFCEIEPNPSISTVQKGGALLRENNCQSVVAIGGGSAMDAGKAIAALATNSENFQTLINYSVFPQSPLPVIAIPTTCGTGSEMNHFAIITDPENKDKLNFSAENSFPGHALLDPELLTSLPKELILATAFDAVTHALEGYVSTRANPFSDTLALAALEEIVATLAQDKPLKPENLSRFLYSSALAGIVISHTGTTLLHSLGYFLTNNCGVHHGTANAILLPYFLKMLSINQVHKHEKMKAILEKYNLQIANYIELMEGPSDLHEILPNEQIEAMVDYALTKKNAALTPFPTTKKFLLEILTR